MWIGPVGGVDRRGRRGGQDHRLDAATDALTVAGYRVLGSSTSGQAARTLGGETGIKARTLASMLWRLERDHELLDARTVVIVDEAGMTNDRDLNRLALGVQRAGAKLVLVGDHRQLSAIGPGGALHALLERRPELVTVLDENVRQHDPAERAALAQLRDGSVPEAVAWYAKHDRIHTTPGRTDTLIAMTDAWHRDTRAGHRTALLAWRREDVADLNRLARHHHQQAGQLTGPELTGPGGRRYAAGDQVIALAPIPTARIVTSQQMTVTAVDPERRALVVRTGDGRAITLGGQHIDSRHLDHGYALTVHRAQGATHDRAHILAAGGGRELGYVAMSRARDHTTIHLTADDLGQAVDDLQRDWGVPRHQRWITHTPTIETGLEPEQRLERDVVPMRQRLDRLTPAAAVAPPTVSQNVQLELQRLHDDLADLQRGEGRWGHAPEGDAARQLHQARVAHRGAKRSAEAPGLRRRERRDRTRTVEAARIVLHQAEQRWQAVGAPVAHQLETDITRTERHLNHLRADDLTRRMDRLQQPRPRAIEGPGRGLGR